MSRGARSSRVRRSGGTTTGRVAPAPGMIRHRRSYCVRSAFSPGAGRSVAASACSLAYPVAVRTACLLCTRSVERLHLNSHAAHVQHDGSPQKRMHVMRVHSLDSSLPVCKLQKMIGFYDVHVGSMSWHGEHPICTCDGTHHSRHGVAYITINVYTFRPDYTAAWYDWLRVRPSGTATGAWRCRWRGTRPKELPSVMGNVICM